ncbi:MAG: tetratricopeptide repeat protein [archaeon]
MDIQNISKISMDARVFAGGNHSPEHMRRIFEFVRDSGVNSFLFDSGTAGLITCDGSFVIYFIGTRDYDDGITKAIEPIYGKKVDMIIISLHGKDADGLRCMTGRGGVIAQLIDLRKKGTVPYLAAYSYNAGLLKSAAEIGFDALVAPYSIGNRVAEGLFSLKPLINIDPYEGGVLIGRDDRESSPDVPDCMSIENALKFALSRDDFITTIVAMESIDHAWQQIQWGLKPQQLTDARRRAMIARSEEFLGKNYCRSCKCCMPCDELGWGYNMELVLRLATLVDKYGLNRYREEYCRLEVRGDACTKCRKCEPGCPFGVPISGALHAAHKLLIASGTGVISEDAESAYNRVWDSQLTGLKSSGDHKAVVAMCEEKLKKYPNNILLLANIGASLIDLGDFDRAYRPLMQAYELAPDLPWIRFDLGRYHLSKGNYDRAIELFDGSLRLMPESILKYHIWIYRAMCYRARGYLDRLSKALSQIRDERSEGSENREEKDFLDGRVS